MQPLTGGPKGVDSINQRQLADQARDSVTQARPVYKMQGLYPTKDTELNTKAAFCHIIAIFALFTVDVYRTLPGIGDARECKLFAVCHTLLTTVWCMSTAVLGFLTEIVCGAIQREANVKYINDGFTV